MLEVAGIEARYGAAVALREVSLAIGAGELVCVVGPNGAGKTTLINVIAGLHRASSGAVRFGGRDLTRLPGNRFCAEGVALVPEGRRLFTTMSVRENLELGSYTARAKALRADSLERACTMFPPLRGWLGRPAGALSGGQQQMVAIARALMARPKLLLLDEPSLGLAPLLVREIFDIIRKINAEQGTTFLLVEQNAQIALRIADYGYNMENGRIVFEGPAAKLRGNQDVREFYLGLSEAGRRKSFKDLKFYKRRKRWAF